MKEIEAFPNSPLNTLLNDPKASPDLSPKTQNVLTKLITIQPRYISR